MADQGNDEEQDLLPDGPDDGAGGSGERDEGIQDISGVGAGSDIESGDADPDPDLPAEGSDGN